MWFDGHFHLGEGDVFEDMYKAALDANVTGMILSGTDLEDSREYAALAGKYDGVYSTVGVHPHDSEKIADLALYEEVVSKPSVVAVGEVGLDFFYDYADKKHQREVFEQFLAMAARLQKPVVVHCREAEQECYEMLKDHPELKWVLHCFTGTPEWGEKFMELGGMITVGGILTFKKAQNVRDMFAVIPDDRFFLETDSPYLAPVPYRGKRNQPAYIHGTAEKVAEMRGWTIAQTAEITTGNAKCFFGIE